MQYLKVTSDLVQVLPDNYDKTKTYPLLIFGHGAAGQNGIDTLKTGELPLVVQQAVDKFGIIVLAPWTPSGWQASHYDKTRDFARVNLSIDWKRVYLAGLSMGGELVTKVLSTSRANDIAAAAVSCGVNRLSTGEFVKAAGTGCIFFHATDDGTVGVQNSRDAVNTVNATGPAVKAKLVEYSNGQHWIWSKVFSITERPWIGNESPATVYDWMLMCTTDKAVEVPITTTPTGLQAAATGSLKDGQIQLDGAASTGYDSISWTYKGTLPGSWVGGTGWKTAVYKPTGKGVYLFELKVSKAGVFQTATVVVDVADTQAPVKKPTDFDDVTDTLFFDDGSQEHVKSAKTNLTTKVTTYITDAGVTYTV